MQVLSKIIQMVVPNTVATQQLMQEPPIHSSKYTVTYYIHGS